LSLLDYGFVAVQNRFVILHYDFVEVQNRLATLHYDFPMLQNDFAVLHYHSLMLQNHFPGCNMTFQEWERICKGGFGLVELHFAFAMGTSPPCHPVSSGESLQRIRHSVLRIFIKRCAPSI